MKWPVRAHPDGIVVSVSALAALAFGAGLSLILAGHFPEAALGGLFYSSYALAWGACLSSISLIFAIVVRRGNFPAGTGLYAAQAVTMGAFLGLQAGLGFDALRPETVYLLGSSILFVWLLLSAKLLTSILGYEEETSLLAGIAAIAAILIFSGYNNVGFVGIERCLMQIWRDCSILLLLHPLLFLMQQFLKSIQDADTTRGDSAFRGLSRSERFYYILHLSAAALQIIALACLVNGMNSSIWIGSRRYFAGLAFGTLPGLVWAFQLWRYRPTHRVEKKQNSSWIGMKTAVLLIDHDPHEECRMHLPALLYRARQLQCEQIIHRTFKRSILSQSATGSQVTLALDPRATASPCVEALTIMSVIYIDGLSLVERRLKTLVNLLPLLDPDMATSLHALELEALFSRLQGFFHLDYSWIDQSRDENKSQLDIRLEHLNARQRQRVLMQLSNSQWLGNFIWISEAAREQIKLESPFLMNAIERLPIKIEHQSGKVLEASIYLIKYENLIPRLQHYYNFDEIRARLSPLPMVTETINYVQALDEDIGQAKTFNNFQAILAEIRNYDWVGFQAKDQALDLVLRTMSLAQTEERQGRIREQDANELRSLAGRVIHRIGYPSQDFHIEHLHKLELRQIQELQKICLDRSHARFEEAWLILASLPSSAMDLNLAIKILSIIKSACKNLDLKSDNLVVSKSIETFFALARVMPENQETDLVQTLNLLADILVADRWEPEMLVSFLDKKVSLDQLKGHNLHIFDDVMGRWEKTIAGYKDEHPKGMAQILIQRWAAHQDLTRVAS